MLRRPQRQCRLFLTNAQFRGRTGMAGRPGLADLLSKHEVDERYHRYAEPRILAAPEDEPWPELLCRYRLCEDQPVSVEIHHAELHHAVILPAKPAGYLDSRHRRVLLVQRFHIVSDDIHVPRLTFGPPRIVWRDVASCCCRNI